MNSIVSQAIRCLFHDKGNPKDWEKMLPTVELVINSLSNHSTGFSPFYLTCGYEPVTPIQLVKGNEEVKTESIGSFIQRITSDWEMAIENLKRSVDLQAKYYDKKHRDIEFDEGDLVLLSTKNLKMTGVPGKLRDLSGLLKLSKELDSKHIDSLSQKLRKYILCFIYHY